MNNQKHEWDLSTPKSATPKALARIAFIALFILLHVLMARNLWLFARDTLTGNLAANQTWPAPQYGFFRIPKTSLTEQYHAHDRLAGDFAQVYFPAQNLAFLDENYRTGNLDPWGRPSRYAPLVHALCALTYCRLTYPEACLVQITAQLFLFYLIFGIAFFLLKIENYLPPAILLVNFCLFLTPAGLSWLERGQFSLYTASSYLLFILAYLRKSRGLIILAAIFAFIKWTSLPFIFVTAVVMLFSSQNQQDFWRNLLHAALFGLTFLLLLGLFPSAATDFIAGLINQERHALPEGISLARLVPVEYAKLLPAVLIGIGLACTRLARNQVEAYLPFLLATGILMTLYPTVAYEYSIVCLLAFLPPILYWAGSWSPFYYNERKILVYVFIIFLLLGSNSEFLIEKTGIAQITYAEYALVSTAFLIAPFRMKAKILPPTRTVL